MADINKQFAVTRFSKLGQHILSKLDNDKRAIRGSTQMLIYGIIDSVHFEHMQHYVRSGSELTPRLIIDGHIEDIECEVNGEKCRLVLDDDYSFNYHYLLNHDERRMFDVSDSVGIYAGDANVFADVFSDWFKGERDDVGIYYDDDGSRIRELRSNEIRFIELIDYVAFMPENTNQMYLVLDLSPVFYDEKYKSVRKVNDAVVEINLYKAIEDTVKQLEGSTLARPKSEEVNVVSIEELAQRDEEAADYLDNIFNDIEEELESEMAIQPETEEKVEISEGVKQLFEEAFPEVSEKVSEAGKDITDAAKESFTIEEEEPKEEEPESTYVEKEMVEERGANVLVRPEKQQEPSIYEQDDKPQVYYEPAEDNQDELDNDDLFL